MSLMTLDVMESCEICLKPDDYLPPTQEVYAELLNHCPYLQFLQGVNRSGFALIDSYFPGWKTQPSQSEVCRRN